MRLFFAIPIPNDIVARVDDLQRRLKDQTGDDGIRWVRPDQYHYTLKFLGEQNLTRAETAANLAAAIAEETAPFELRLDGLGAFPNEERPSVLWLGALAGGEEVTTLASRIDDVLSRRGFQREKKAAKAHLTLARIKTYVGEVAAAKLLRKRLDAECGAFTVDRFVLMRSFTRPEGSEYDVVREFPLARK